jgi:N-acetylglucosamine-6-phosphate deacetylase
MRFCANILLPAGTVNAAIVEVDELGRIIAIDRDINRSIDHDFSGFFALPGFVDTHVHGAGGSDFMDADVEGVRTVARTHAKHGTTAMLATTLTASRQDIDRAIGAIVEVMLDPNDDEATIIGIHLEGPYICAHRRGAQPEASIRQPSIDELVHWLEISGDRIKQITLAPEIEGAVPFIRYAVSRGVNVSIGHTDATFFEVEAAIAAGARIGTHLFNAMSGLSHRKPGAVGALLTDDRTHCELICDGLHIDPAVVKLAMRAKGTSRIHLITDAMSGASMPDGEYQLGGQPVLVRGGAARLTDGTLAGSVLTMNRALINAINFTEASIHEASHMSSLNAAFLCGADREMGTIEPGKRADIVIIDPLSGEVQATFKAGRLAYLRAV